MSMCRVVSCWKRVFAMTSAFSWQNFVSLCPASFCIHRPNLLVTPGVSWLPSFAVPYNEKNIFFLVLVRRSCRFFIEPFNFSSFGINGWGIDLYYCDIKWFALDTSRDHSVIFEIVPKYCISDCLLTMRATPFPLRDSFPL